MALLREVGVSLNTGLATALARPRHTLLIAFGFVVAGITLAVLLTIPAGLKRLAGHTGSPDIAVVLPNGTSTESGGSFNSALASLVGGLPGVARAADGGPLVAPQFVVDTRLPRKDGSTATVLLRGVTPTFWSVVGDAISMHSGRRFQSGKDALIAGVAATRGFASLQSGATISIQKRPWLVSGEFTANGGFWESELWTDMSTLQATFNAQGKLTCLWVKLTSPAAFATFDKALHDNPQTQGLHALRQPRFYEDQSLFLRWFIRIATAGIALALGTGAALAIANALGMALDARKRELAVLRAVGFRRAALAAALLLEVLAIGIVCAGIAILIAWLTVDNREVGSSTLASAVQFKMHVDSGVVGSTLVYLLLLGLASAVWPIIRAVRAPLTKALQDE